MQIMLLPYVDWELLHMSLRKMKNEFIIAYCCILANKTIQNMEGKI